MYNWGARKSKVGSYLIKCIIFMDGYYLSDTKIIQQLYKHELKHAVADLLALF